MSPHAARIDGLSRTRRSQRRAGPALGLPGSVEFRQPEKTATTGNTGNPSQGQAPYNRWLLNVRSIASRSAERGANPSSGGSAASRPQTRRKRPAEIPEIPEMPTQYCCHCKHSVLFTLPQGKEVSVENVPIWRTANGAGRRAKGPANQPVDPRNRRHEPISMWGPGNVRLSPRPARASSTRDYRHESGQVQSVAWGLRTPHAGDF